MATRPGRTPTDQRLPLVYITVGVLGFLGISATAGGAALAVGGSARPPDDWLGGIPVIDSWLVPGLVLGLGFGLGSLVTAYGVLRRPRWPALAIVERGTGHHWSWIATSLIGWGHVGWILLELIYLPAPAGMMMPEPTRRHSPPYATRSSTPPARCSAHPISRDGVTVGSAVAAVAAERVPRLAPPRPVARAADSACRRNRSAGSSLRTVRSPGGPRST